MDMDMDTDMVMDMVMDTGTVMGMDMDTGTVRNKYVLIQFIVIIYINLKY